MIRQFSGCYQVICRRQLKNCIEYDENFIYPNERNVKLDECCAFCKKRNSCDIRCCYSKKENE